MAGVAVKTGYSPSQIVSAAKPEIIPADGIALMLTVVFEDNIEQPCAFVTRTLTCSPSFNVVEEIVFEVLEAAILTPFKKNSYRVPPEAVKTMLSPVQEGVVPPFRIAVGGGSAVTRTEIDSTEQIDPLTVDVATRLKSVVTVNAGGS